MPKILIKKMAKKKEQKVKKVIEEVVRLGKCLSCGHALGKNKDTCTKCRKKLRLQKKANRRGKRRDYYLK